MNPSATSPTPPTPPSSASPATPHHPAPDRPIRVLVADDHPAVRGGLVALLEADPSTQVVAQAADGDEAVRRARAERPDVALTDVRMPGATGIEITPALRELGARVLVISAFDLDSYVLGALAAGADGYLVKTEEPRRILDAVHAVASGDAVLSSAATRAVVAALRSEQAPGEPAQGAQGGSGRDGEDPRASARAAWSTAPANTDDSAASSSRSATWGPAPGVELTRREEDVLRLLAQGMSNQQIARELVVEVTTVKTHITHVLGKLQVDSRVQAALWWQQHRE
ncbi:DNA-binding response regulator [Brachybacterium endophyticum]|uniref:DNA-binding response regulator n=1 Tax=Brachybacterium endophyticum TaxID=2182385 RepID=A0A2U2RNS7_9MICO|nr:response regulator transcription factor [Brachybacterium endophyticum]PWH07445.1 DNA-binding response regulator [Brachybacterium endophyticum]